MGSMSTATRSTTSTTIAAPQTTIKGNGQGEELIH